MPAPAAGQTEVLVIEPAIAGTPRIAADRATRQQRVVRMTWVRLALAAFALLWATLPSPVGAAGDVVQAVTAAPLRGAGAYPADCLNPKPIALLPELVAGVADGKVTIAAPTATLATTVGVHLSPEQSSVGWSIGGLYLATGDGRIWTRDGRSAGRLFGRLTGPWAWSPNNFCAVGITVGSLDGPATMSVGEVGRHSHPLLRGRISDFTFTPDGRALIVVAQSGDAPDITASFWRLELATGELTRLAQLGTGTCCVNLGTFAPGGLLLRFWGAPGGSVKADGWTLSAINVVSGGRPIYYGVAGHSTLTLPRADFVTACGTKTLAVVGTSRNSTRVFDKRLAFVAPGHLPQFLTSAPAVFESPACSPDATQIAAPQGTNGGPFDRLRLTLLTSTGKVVRFLDDGGAFGDYLPEWAARGILFERLPDNATTAQLWFIPTGGSAKVTPLRADGGPDTWDWSATPPTGRASF